MGRRRVRARTVAELALSVVPPRDPMRRPVVELTFDVPNSSDPPAHCTGEFIAKNWIATAAHCIFALDTRASG